MRGDDASYRGRFNYAGDRYGFEVDRLVVGLELQSGSRVRPAHRLRAERTHRPLQPAPETGTLVRMLTWQADFDYISDAAGDMLEDRSISGRFGVEFNSSDEVGVDCTRQYELLPFDFAISPGVVVPAGGYTYETLNATYTLGQQRKISGRLSASYGSFYEGTRTSLTYSGRIGFSAHFGVEPNITLNWVRLPYGDFNARLLGMRIGVAPTARLGFSGLTQFNPSSRTLTSSARMRWEYMPGSELFVVYSDGRDTAVHGYPALQNRSFAVKVTRLLRF